MDFGEWWSLGLPITRLLTQYAYTAPVSCIDAITTPPTSTQPDAASSEGHTDK